MTIKKEIVNKLKARKAMIHYDINDIEALQRVLKEIWPRDTYIATGVRSYYVRHKLNDLFWAGTDVDTGELEIFKLSEMIEKTKGKAFIAPMNLFCGAIPKGTVYVKHTVAQNGYYPKHLVGGDSTFYLPNEIVEQWEEYEENIEQIFTMRYRDGQFDLRVDRDGIYYDKEKAQIDQNALRKIATPLVIESKTGMVNSYLFRQVVEFVDLGCKKQVPVEDIWKVLEYYTSLQSKK